MRLSFGGYFLRSRGLLWFFPCSLCELVEWRRASPCQGCGLVSWRINRIFRGSFLLAEDLVSAVELRVAKWTLLRKEFVGMSLDCIIWNWKFCMFCGPSKVRNVVFWCPPVGWLKFNVDGVTKGKPGLRGSS
eukprot:TRINITY_DN2969_c1_g3_i2.p1 TRINITY_DN2969_c1_g3~~TRINITY_DN2969_c1_g3_i2.p1  ORF type:complete len:132 (-),score=19.85 TRINITY_DN2969_c1_g3_i2:155-550(-)